MALGGRCLSVRTAHDCGKKPESVRASLIGECSALHLGRKAFSLSCEGFGGAKQSLPGQFKLQFVGQGIPSDPANPGVSEKHGSDPIKPLALGDAANHAVTPHSRREWLKLIPTKSDEMQDDHRQWREADLYRRGRIQPNRRRDAAQHDDLSSTQPAKCRHLV